MAYYFQYQKAININTSITSVWCILQKPHNMKQILLRATSMGHATIGFFVENAEPS